MKCIYERAQLHFIVETTPTWTKTWLPDLFQPLSRTPRPCHCSPWVSVWSSKKPAFLARGAEGLHVHVNAEHLLEPQVALSRTDFSVFWGWTLGDTWRKGPKCSHWDMVADTVRRTMRKEWPLGILTMARGDGACAGSWRVTSLRGGGWRKTRRSGAPYEWPVLAYRGKARLSAPQSRKTGKLSAN